MFDVQNYSTTTIKTITKYLTSHTIKIKCSCLNYGKCVNIDYLEYIDYTRCDSFSHHKRKK